MGHIAPSSIFAMMRCGFHAGNPCGIEACVAFARVSWTYPGGPRLNYYPIPGSVYEARNSVIQCPVRLFNARGSVLSGVRIEKEMSNRQHQYGSVSYNVVV